LQPCYWSLHNNQQLCAFNPFFFFSLKIFIPVIFTTAKSHAIFANAIFVPFQEPRRNPSGSKAEAEEINKEKVGKMTSVMAVDSAVVLRVGEAHRCRRPPGTTSVPSSGSNNSRVKLLPLTGVGAASGQQQQQLKRNSSDGTAVQPSSPTADVVVSSHHSTQRLHFLTHCGTVWVGCLRDQVRHCWTMFTKRKKGQSYFIF
jgi:hypothetical protein